MHKKLHCPALRKTRWPARKLSAASRPGVAEAGPDAPDGPDGPAVMRVIKEMIGSLNGKVDALASQLAASPAPSPPGSAPPPGSTSLSSFLRRDASCAGSEDAAPSRLPAVWPQVTMNGPPGPTTDGA